MVATIYKDVGSVLSITKIVYIFKTETQIIYLPLSGFSEVHVSKKKKKDVIE